MDMSGATQAIPGFAPFQPGEKAAAIAVFLVSLVSTLVLSLVLLCVVWVIFSAIFKRTSHQNLSREAFFFRSQLGQYAACLLLSNWIRGVSGSIDMNWIRAGGVKSGSSCSAQGSLRQIGQYASFFFIVAMGIHTFNTLVLRNRPPHWLGPAVTSIGWASAVVIGVAPVLIPGGVNGPLYNIDDFSCDISNSYEVVHMFLYFLPLFLASLLSAIIYSLIFLVLRGTLAINGGLKIHIDPERRLRLLNGTFEEYQRFIYSVARTMLWLPISFVLALFPSSVVQLMEISGITVSPGAMAFACVLERLDGVINVIILFNVLKALGPAMKSTASMDFEKGRSERIAISRPMQSTFTSEIQESETKPSLQGRSPDTILQGSRPRIYSLAKSLFRPHKKSRSTMSFTHLLASTPPSRSPSLASSLERSESLSSASLVGGPIAPAPVFENELAVPPKAIRKSTLPALPSDHLSIHLPPQHASPTSLSPPPRGERSRISRDLSPVPGSPTMPVVPFLEVTLCSPTISLAGDDVGSMINMYISRYPTMSVELPPFPDTAIHRDFSTSFPLSISEPPVSPTADSPGPSVVDLPVTVPSEGVGLPLKAAVSIGAVGGRSTLAHPPSHPELPSAHATSPADSTDASRYSDSSDAPPSREVSVVRETSAGAQSRAPREGRPSVPNRPTLRALPLPPSRPAPSPAQSIQLHKSPSSSSRYGYL